MAKKLTVRLEPLGIWIKANPGTPLSDLLHEYGIEFPCNGKGTCHNCKVRILAGDVDTEPLYARVLQEKGMDPSWRLACKSSIVQDVTLEIAQLNTFILADNTTFSFKPAEGYGLSVDLGTTTIVIQLVDLSNGHILDAVTSLNPQRRFGEDIMSRIGYALNKRGLESLCQLIREHLWRLVHTMIEKNGIIPNRIIMVGNTVMHHLFAGIDVRSLAFYPFESREGGRKRFQASDLGWKLPAQTEIIFMPAIGSFVGSDILAGILATGMDRSEDYLALIDLGTNGEIVIGNRDHMLTASTAAGPAFEGTHISQGMRASTGAISGISFRNHKVECHVLGNEKPHGICGSGLIDAVAVFLQTGRIDETGQIPGGETSLSITETIKLTQKDIFEFILAKAAITSGLVILTTMLGKTDHDIKKVFIAGGFGHFITLSNAISTGLFDYPEEKIIKAGNTALIGAKMMLFREDDYEKMIAERIRHISLESDTHFQDIFAGNMMLKKTADQ